MRADNIKQIFSEYLKSRTTFYALLINGAWGSGKTFLWKVELERVAQIEDFRTIYISLNGISKIDQLEYQMFVKLLPLLNKVDNKHVKNFAAVFSNILNKLSSNYLKIGLNELFKGASIDSYNFSKHVICFDDLERCQIPVKEVLGYINNYVEHKAIKTVIMADESNMVPDKDLQSYDSIKEKVIGRILKYEPDLQTILPVIIKGYEKLNAGYFRFLEKHTDFILQLLTEYKEKNLRVVSFYLEVLERLQPLLNDTNEKCVNEVILCSLALCLEFKKGRIVSADYNNYKNLDNLEKFIFSIRVSESLSSKRGKKENKTPQEITYAETFYETYITNHSGEFFFYPSVYNFILTGFLDKDLLSAEIRSRVPANISDAEKCYQALVNYKFRELPDTEFTDMAAKLLRYARDGKYNIYDYPNIASAYFFFVREGLVESSEEDVKNSISEGLAITKLESEIDSHTLENLMHFKNENEEVEKIKVLVKEIHTEKVKAVLSKEASALLESLARENESDLISIFEKYNVMDTLFPYLDSDRLFSSLIGASNKLLFHFTERLVKRYNPSNIGDFLFNDHECLNAVKEKLSGYITNSDIAQPRKYLLTTLINELEAICQKIEKKNAVTSVATS